MDDREFDKDDIKSLAKKYGVYSDKNEQVMQEPQEGKSADGQEEKDPYQAMRERYGLKNEPVQQQVSLQSKAKGDHKKSGKVQHFFQSLLPWKGDPFKEILRKIVFLVSVIALIVCGIYFADRLIERIQNQNQGQQIVDQVEDAANKDPKKYMEQLKSRYPNVKFPEGIQAKYAELYALNQDTVGWLKVSGTTIDIPILQTKDNEFYLKHDFYKKSTAYGNPFLDYNDGVRELSRNSILYGHNMKDKMIFADLIKQYSTMDGYKKSPVIEFNTIFKDYKWKVIAAFYTNAQKAQDNGYIFNYIATDMSGKKFSEYLAQIKQRSVYWTGVDVKNTDKILTLSTCDYTIKPTGRFVVVARLVRDGESAAVEVSKVKKNPNPRYPQAYCTKKGIKNNYKNAPKWYPY